MNKTFISIVIAIMALGGIIWFASPSREQNGVAQLNSQNITSLSSAKGDGTLIVEESNNYDFGTISMAAGNVKHTFKIKNPGDKTITITKLYTSCMCTTALLEIRGETFGPYGMLGHGFIPKINQSINPNEWATIEVIFDPAAHGPAGIGRIQRAITIENNVGQPIELQFAAIVTP